MKQVLIFCIIFFLVACEEKIVQKPKQITISGQKWYLEIPTALSIAQKEQKNLLVMVSEEYCRWCIKMEEETLTQTSIQKKLKEYVLVSVKRSDKKSIQYLDDFDGNIPSFFFIEPQTGFVESIIGYYEASSFLDYLREIEDDR